MEKLEEQGSKITLVGLEATAEDIGVSAHEVVPMSQEIPRGPTREVEPGVPEVPRISIVLGSIIVGVDDSPEVIQTPFEATAAAHEKKRAQIEELRGVLAQITAPSAPKPQETAEHYKAALFCAGHTLFAAGQILRAEMFRCPVSGAAWTILSDLAEKCADLRTQVDTLVGEARAMPKDEAVR